MSVAIRAITRLQDADDVNVSLGAGVDEYALCWDNDTARFALRATTGYDHGLLAAASLLDDDHPQYLLVSGTRAMTGALKMTGNVTTALTEISSIAIKNASNTVAKIAVETTDTTQDDGNLVFYLALNGSLTEKLRIPRTGEITFANICYFESAHCWVNGDANGNMEIGGRIATAFHTGLSSRNYAYFHRDSGAYLAPYTNLTNTIRNAIDLRHNTSGTPAAGFGTSLSFALKTSTTESTAAACIQALWYEATHATRKADLVLSAYDTAEREGLRIRGNGSAPAIGFYGVAPIARATLATGAGASVDDVITALQNLGLVKQS